MLFTKPVREPAVKGWEPRRRLCHVRGDGADRPWLRPRGRRLDVVGGRRRQLEAARLDAPGAQRRPFPYPLSIGFGFPRANFF